MESGVADLAVVGEDLSTRLADGFLHVTVACMDDALITLTVVVGTDVEDGMVVAIVPADQLVVLLDEREEVIGSVLVLATLLHLGQQPRTADDGMGLEELG